MFVERNIFLLFCRFNQCFLMGVCVSCFLLQCVRYLYYRYTVGPIICPFTWEPGAESESVTLTRQGLLCFLCCHNYNTNTFGGFIKSKSTQNGAWSHVETKVSPTNSWLSVFFFPQWVWLKKYIALWDHRFWLIFPFTKRAFWVSFF